MSIVRKNRVADIDELKRDEILKFLNENYEFTLYDDPVALKEVIKIQDNIVDVSCEVRIINNKITSLTNGLFEFGVVDGYFDCSDCPNLKSLKGAPKKVKRYFNCSNCNNLTSLEGAPKKIGGSFNCHNCPNLKSLEGSPVEVSRNFLCRGCKNLKSLEGAPIVIKGRFIHDEYLK